MKRTHNPIKRERWKGHIEGLERAIAVIDEATDYLEAKGAELAFIQRIESSLEVIEGGKGKDDETDG